MEFAGLFTDGTGNGRCAKVAPQVRVNQSNQRVADKLLQGIMDFDGFSPTLPLPRPPGEVKSFDTVQDLMSTCYDCESGTEAKLTGLEDFHEKAKLQGLPSRGSFGHPYYCGAPCKYARRKSNCRERFQCLSCHWCKWTRKSHGLRGWERICQQEEEDLDIKQEGNLPLPEIGAPGNLRIGEPSNGMFVGNMKQPRQGLQLTSTLKQWPMENADASMDDSGEDYVDYFSMRNLHKEPVQLVKLSL